MIYLDNSATTKPDDKVIQVMTDVMKQVYGNPSSLHGIGAKAERLLDQSRAVIARCIGCSTGELVFTSGGTESNNLAIYGASARGKHFITTEVEHPSVIEVMQSFERKGWKITYLPVDPDTGQVNPLEVEQAITDETSLVSVMHVNNEIGSVQPIEEIGRIIKKYPKVWFHVDAVQSFGKMKIPIQWIDMFSFSGHKIHGPKGIGGLYVRKHLPIEPLLLGGEQERGLRSGTENVPAIAGLAKAVQLLHDREVPIPEWKRWKEQFQTHITQSLPQVIFHKVEPDVPYIINFSIPSLRSEVLVHALEEQGIHVSTGSACSSKKEKPSRVLLAMGKSREEALSSIRISLGLWNEENDLSLCAKALITSIPTLQQVIEVQKR